MRQYTILTPPADCSIQGITISAYSERAMNFTATRIDLLVNSSIVEIFAISTGQHVQMNFSYNPVWAQAGDDISIRVYDGYSVVGVLNSYMNGGMHSQHFNYIAPSNYIDYADTPTTWEVS